MIETQILWNDEGLIWLGKEGEGAFGRRNFLELFSVFNSPPMFTVRHGQSDIGQVDVLSFLLGSSESTVLLLGGRSWLVTHLIWDKRVAYVRPTEQRGKSRWSGAGQALSYELCQAIRRAISSEEYPAFWSSRACDEMVAVRIESDWASLEKTSAVISEGNLTWWTFGGLRANSALAERVQDMTDARVTFDNLSIEFEPFITHDNFGEIIESVRREPPVLGPRKHLERAIEGLKFSVCLPPDLAEEMLRRRTADAPAVEAVLSEGIRHITA
jgi:ATP-dependent Lhr-like helicase